MNNGINFYSDISMADMNEDLPCKDDKNIDNKPSVSEFRKEFYPHQAHLLFRVFIFTKSIKGILP